MKELSIKEKAKAYDEAIERAKKWYNAPNIDKIPTYGNRIIEEIFPELKESEDERIRKRLIFDFKVIGKTEWGGLEVKDILAWLEKQGNPTEINPSEFDLRLNKLLKQFETLPKEELASSLSFYLNVVQNDGTYRESKPCEQKPAWSEEDEAIRNDLINYFRGSALETPEKEVINFLESLKERVLPQPKQEWSEKDALRLEEVMCMIEANGRWVRSDDAVKSVLDWLKSLQQRIGE